MSESAIDSLASQMFQYIMEQFPILMLIIAATLLILGIIFALNKMGLLAPQPNTHAQPSVDVENLSDIQKLVLHKLDALHNELKGVNNEMVAMNANVDEAKELFIMMVQTKG
jgi:hypothetical protein